MKAAAVGRILADYAWWAGRRVSSGGPRPSNGPISVDAHRLKVRALQRTLETARPPLRTWRNRIGHSTRSPNRFDGTWVDITTLNDVVEVDAGQRTVIVEPLVTMEGLLRVTAPLGLRPAVVPEFSQMTVGGSIQGLAGESTSHREGLFHESLEWMELLLPDGRLVVVSPEEDPDLWRDLPGSYGTLAIVTLVKLRLVEMPPFVELRYDHMDVAGFVRAVHASSEWEFMDAICGAQDRCIVMRGRGVSRPTGRVYAPGHLSPWFDQHVGSHRDGEREAIPAVDYLFRYDRGAFFVASSKLGSAWWSRAAFGSYATAENLYRLRRLSSSSTRIVQDVGIPIDRFESFVRRLRSEIVTTGEPLWLCPIRQGSDVLFGPPRQTSINVGIYNRSGEEPGAFVEMNRAIERLTREHGGFKVLYAANYYTEGEFWSIYDREAYQRARRRCGADGRLEDIFQKLSPGAASS
jgi:Delta24-sterol reductase